MKQVITLLLLAIALSGCAIKDTQIPEMSDSSIATWAFEPIEDVEMPPEAPTITNELELDTLHLYGSDAYNLYLVNISGDTLYVDYEYAIEDKASGEIRILPFAARGGNRELRPNVFIAGSYVFVAGTVIDIESNTVIRDDLYDKDFKYLSTEFIYQPTLKYYVLMSTAHFPSGVNSSPAEQKGLSVTVYDKDLTAIASVQDDEFWGLNPVNWRDVQRYTQTEIYEQYLLIHGYDSNQNIVMLDLTNMESHRISSYVIADNTIITCQCFGDDDFRPDSILISKYVNGVLVDSFSKPLSETDTEGYALTEFDYDADTDTITFPAIKTRDEMTFPFCE